MTAALAERRQWHASFGRCAGKDFAFLLGTLANEAGARWRVRGETDLAGRLSCIAPDRLAVILRLDAAGVTGTVLIAAGQDAAQQRKDPPAWVKSENDRDRWEHSFDERDKLLRKLAEQARAALSADQPEADHSNPEGETNDSGAA
jgi:hypothetical protein